MAVNNGANSPADGELGWLEAGRHALSGARRHPRYELFVLGELMNGPLHGYRLHEILNRVLGPFRQISWGALYPLVHGLEREGLIEADAEPGAEPRQDGAGNRQRHSYRIAETGRERFRILMREPAAYTPDYPEIFMIKLNLFGYIALAEQLAILQHHRTYLHTIGDYVLNEQRYVTGRATLPEHERPHILRLLDYRLNLVQAEVTWIDAEIARFAGIGDDAPDGPSSRRQEPADA